MDGAGPMRTYVSVILPQLRGALSVAVLINIINVFNSLPILKVMTGSIPGYDADTIMTLIFKYIQNQHKVDVASALSVVAFLIVIVIVAVYVKVVKPTEGGLSRGRHRTRLRDDRRSAGGEPPTPLHRGPGADRPRAAAHARRPHRAGDLHPAVHDHVLRLGEDEGADPLGRPHLLPHGVALGELRQHVVDPRDAAAAEPHLDDRHRGLRDRARARGRDARGVLHGAIPVPRALRVPLPRDRHADAAARGAHLGPVPPVRRPRPDRHLGRDDLHQRRVQPVVRGVDHALVLRRRAEGDRRGGPDRRRGRGSPCCSGSSCRSCGPAS